MYSLCLITSCPQCIQPTPGDIRPQIQHVCCMSANPDRRTCIEFQMSSLCIFQTIISPERERTNRFRQCKFVSVDSCILNSGREGEKGDVRLLHLLCGINSWCFPSMGPCYSWHMFRSIHMMEPARSRTWLAAPPWFSCGVHLFP